MKKLFCCLFISALFPFLLTAQNLYIVNQAPAVPVSAEGSSMVWNSSGLQIWISDTAPFPGASLLAVNPWESGHEVVLFDLHRPAGTISFAETEYAGTTIFSNADLLIMKTTGSQLIALREAVGAPMIRLMRPKSAAVAADLPPVDTNQVVYEIVDKVDTASIMATIGRLQAFVTRKATSDSAFAASQWIRQQFEAMGYQVELQDFNIYGTPASPNVIATKTGTTYPDKYVMMGGHYDSYTWTGSAPGADDNASGTAGVLEAARILADYPTECTVVFCAFSGEEYGLFGSEAYVSRCKSEGMNILGYFNLDMIGYRHPGDDIHTDMIYPLSASPLADYYKGIAAIFVPGLGVYDGYLTSGDSDHTSFNEHGYMGIFTFEDDENYSPYIHTVEDLVGLSVNSARMAGMLTQAALAGVSSLGGVFSYVDAGGRPSAAITALIPNPAENRVRIISSDFGTNAEVKILSVDGRCLMLMPFPSDGLIRVSDLPAGLYILQVTAGDRSAVAKLMKR